MTVAPGGSDSITRLAGAGATGATGSTTAGSATAGSAATGATGSATAGSATGAATTAGAATGAATTAGAAAFGASGGADVTTDLPGHATIAVATRPAANAADSHSIVRARPPPREMRMPG